MAAELAIWVIEDVQPDFVSNNNRKVRSNGLLQSPKFGHYCLCIATLYRKEIPLVVGNEKTIVQFKSLRNV